jgi:hypothetical protein
MVQAGMSFQDIADEAFADMLKKHKQPVGLMASLKESDGEWRKSPPVTAGDGDYSVHVVVGLDPAGRMYVPDLWRKQTASDECARWLGVRAFVW